eukprot:CAMPEP_0197491486 /NCGR_PEP_ID=MMETSP1311-20131121/5740_1 /TAXON_ID=464262 /ORGANISM="Genus nov. species nov., Strain RCC856" /LENGTH=105 /DNA_ID=CAMNT_0043036161 /DNA_START=178 /DNA_END=495 /DNA_ORIENTATION=-
MPKRSTLFFTSDHAARAAGDGGEGGAAKKLFIYTCRYSGKLALVTDVSLRDLPIRRADESSVLDLERHPETKSYLSSGGVKKIRRSATGKVEKQFRLHLGSLPVA